MSIELVKWGPPLLSGLITGGLALGGIMLNHRLTRQRDKLTELEKRSDEIRFISIEVIFILEEFAEKCANVASDWGEPTPPQGEYEAEYKQPTLDLSSVSGDWKVLPAKIMYQIKELPIRQREASRYISDVYDNDWDPPEHISVFSKRQLQYAKLGLKAIQLSSKLRKLSSLPTTRLNATDWSPQQIMWKAWRRHTGRNRTSTPPIVPPLPLDSSNTME